MARFTLLLTALALVACGSRDDDVIEDAGTGDSMVGTDMGAPDLDVDTGTGTDTGAPDLGPMDAGPDCTGLPVCTTEGVSCDGDTRVVCGHNAAGCLVESRIDCTTTPGGTCSDVGALAHCTVDVCASLPSACTTPSRTCEGTVLVTCAPSPSGCLYTSRADCATIGSTCLPDEPLDAGVPDGGGDGGMPRGAVCSSPDPCFRVDPTTICPTEGRFCTTSTQLDDCHPNSTGCLVDTRTDCSAGASPLAHCDDTIATPSCVDPCAGLTLCAPGDPPQRCQGARIVTCTTDTTGCYVRTETNCAATGMGCDPGGGTPMCSGDLCPSAVGTIDCSSIRVTGNTTATSDILPTNSCDASPYPAHDGIWLFTNAVGAVAHLQLTAVSDSTHAYDMFVLDGSGSACDPSAPCVASTTSTGTRSVDFSVAAGGRRYVVIDGMTAGSTTSYAIIVDCDLCGDGVIAPPEQCDDGNTTTGDGCDDSCLIERGFACSGTPTVCHPTVCGNSIPEPGETCDDGNTIDGDGCSSICLAETFTTLPGLGGTITVTGSLTSADPTYTRPYQDCSTDSGTGGVSYDTYVLANTGTVPVTITVTATWSLFGDGYLFAYRPPFVAGMPGIGCLVGDDDFGGTDESQITFTVAPGTQVVLVATEFDPGSATGSYSLSIHAM